MTTEDTSWRHDALCAYEEHEATFLNSLDVSETEMVDDPEWATPLLDEAKAVCADCPVRADCLAQALAEGEEWGVWGGADPVQLRKLRAVARKQAKEQ